MKSVLLVICIIAACAAAAPAPPLNKAERQELRVAAADAAQILEEVLHTLDREEIKRLRKGVRRARALMEKRGAAGTVTVRGEKFNRADLTALLDVLDALFDAMAPRKSQLNRLNLNQ